LRCGRSGNTHLSLSILFLFLLIGLQVRLGELLHMWRAAVLSIAAVLVARLLTVYGLVPFSNLFSTKIPLRWQHVLVWGGMRGALSLALVLSIGNSFPYRDQLLNLTFGVVAFTIVVQGITLKPLSRAKEFERAIPFF
jgi:CPA1 family monovalent cation:H+ antiporter